MAIQTGRARYQTASGAVFNVNAGDVDKFLADNPGSTKLGLVEYGPADADRPEVEAGGDIHQMKVAQLKRHAAANGIDLGGATTKADILAAIEAAEADGDDNADND